MMDILYGGPPAEFTATRNALAKGLRKDGEKGRAEAVTRLRRPTRLAAEVNRIVREDRAGVERLIAAASALADAQADVIAGRADVGVMREAEAEESLVLSLLTDLAADDAPAGLGPALRAAARAPDMHELLRRGWLTTEPDPHVGGLFGAPMPSAPAPAAPPRKAPAPAAAEPADTPGREEAAARLQAALAALEEARAAAGAAGQERERASEAADRARQEAASAHQAVDAAQAELETRQRAAEEADRRRRETEEAAGAAGERRAAAERGLAAAEREAQEAVAEGERATGGRP
jgi:hypothetical protein